ncbi:hypothetical protein BKA67DRAFT_3027 [Truncatella angustata]|uniref:Uncharacterized protein n=1 Tax=Truncatella angustata TaxID=152316 RepID=A0A9P8UV98_9PEZI|nr:uncharacterized protein BKA67DRAFT_3027 [Truncatella angustata]KAH6658975.1 hypothetical protein BKA67DRAFT_3027 [Truncatella angustata]
MSKADHGPADEAPTQQISKRDSNLRLISSPLVSELDEKSRDRVQSAKLTFYGGPDVENLGLRYKDDDSYPEFIKHANSTNYELFYDLWFVANLEVFSSSKGVSKESDLYAYVGYLSILWFTWFNVGMFDVRFVTDSLFERIIRTAHLGVMVGFSIVVTYFDPNDQQQSPFRILSYILMVSRLVLVIQYCTVLWHIRHYKKGKVHIAIAALVHFIAAVVFLGISFRFEEGRNSRVYIVWYIVAACEALIQLGFAKFFKVLTFEKTHLTERMTVLTVIILGAGITSIAKNVVLIVKNAAGWTSATIGVLTSAIATMYFFFMIYFDWMNHHNLSSWRQLIWSILHFPFHVCLLLFLEGATQFMIWWKVNELENYVEDQFLGMIDRLSDGDTYITSDVIVNELNKTITGIFEIYPTKYILTDERISFLLADVKSLPQGLWDNGSAQYLKEEDQFQYDLVELIYAIINSLFVNFNIDPFVDMGPTDSNLLQDQALTEINERYYTVFQYAYITAGLVLMLMTIMFAATRKHGWTPFVIFRTALFGLMGLGLTLIELISQNEQRSLNYLFTPWLLPTICIVFFVVLLL